MHKEQGLRKREYDVISIFSDLAKCIKGKLRFGSHSVWAISIKL